MKKKTFVIAVVLLFALSVVAYADVQIGEKIKIDDSVNEFLIGVSEFSSQRYTYIAENLVGEDVLPLLKEKFFRYTLEPNYLELKKYIVKNEIRLYRISHEFLSSGDVAKTHEELFIKDLEQVNYSYHPAYVSVECIMRGTIYYNPNTYVISTVSNPYVHSIRMVSPYTFNNMTNNSYKLNNYKAYFSTKFHVYNSVPATDQDMGYFKAHFYVEPN